MKRLIPLSAALLLAGLVLLLGSCREPEMPRGYALIYGVTDYSPAWNNFLLNSYDLSDLTYTYDDAVAMAELFREKGWEVRLRLDDGTATVDDWDEIGRADLATFQSDIAELSILMEADDRFLFDYSGHGYDSSLGGEGNNNSEPASGISGDEWIFLYTDTGVDWSTDLWSDHTLNDDMLGAELSKLPNRIKTVILDSCHSGGFLGTNAGVDTLPADYTTSTDILTEENLGADAIDAVQAWFYYPDVAQADVLPSQALVLAAAGEAESSMEDPYYGHGIFTYYFLESPTKGDADGDGWVTVGEAYSHCLERIEEDWNTNYPSAAYLPHLSGSPLDFVLFAAD